jgi:hypothetical protein
LHHYWINPIYIKLEETARYYYLTKEGKKDDANIDKDTTITHWLHPATTMTVLTNNNDDKIKYNFSLMGASPNRG